MKRERAAMAGVAAREAIGESLTTRRKLPSSSDKLDGWARCMGMHTFAAGPSLDRLKALDALPTLASQLAEATQLCTHPVRADMILKWIVDRLKTDRHARHNPDTWQLMTSTIRLLPPERIGSSLSSIELLSTIAVSLAELRDPSAVLAVAKDLYLVLLDLSEANSGVAVRAVLSVEASVAALAIGSWYHALVQAITSDAFDGLDSSRSTYVHIASRLWNLRKRSSEENVYFEENALIPLCRFLSMLSPIAQATQRKRSHRSESETLSTETELLESLLAKHVCLPCRAAFFGSQNPTMRTKNRQNKPEPRTLDATSVCRTLVAAIEDGKHGTSEEMFKCIPIVLDVSLRAAPAQSPQQRIRERPWVEFLWRELFQIVYAVRREAFARTAAISMLTAVGRGGLLSTECLEEVVEGFAGLDGSIRSGPDWDIIAKVIEVEPSVVATKSSSEALFSELTLSIVAMEQRSLNETDQSNALLRQQLRSLAKHGIVGPLLLTFSRSRNLGAFVELWNLQLQRDQHSHLWSIWTELEDLVTPLVEDSLTEDQIFDLFSTFQAMVCQILRESNPSDSKVQLGAAAVILRALLRGINSERIHDRLQSGLGQLVSVCLTPERHKNLPGEDEEFWKMLEVAFELWYPLWSQTLASNTDIDKQSIDMISGQAITAALKALQAADTKSKLPNPLAECAACFLTTICYYLSGVEVSRNTCKDVLNKLTEQLHPQNLLSLLRYPQLLTLIDKEVLGDLVRKCVNSISSRSKAAEESLTALLASASEVDHAELVSEIASATLQLLKPNDSDTDLFAADAAVRIVSAIPATHIVRALRERVLDILSDLPFSGSLDGDMRVRRRLALMIQLMEVSNPTSNLSTDATILQNMAEEIDLDMSKAGAAEKTTDWTFRLALFRELLRLVVRHMLDTQEQARSHKMLSSLSKLAKKKIKALSKGNAEAGSVVLLTSVIVRDLENGGKDSLLCELPHHNEQTARQWISYLLEHTDMLRTYFSSNVQQLSQDTSWSLDRSMAVLQALMDMPSSFLNLSELDVVQLLEPMKLFLRRATDSKPDAERGEETVEQPHLARVRKIALARCYSIICHLSPAGADVEHALLAEKLLEIQLMPVEHEQVVQAFSKCVELIDVRSRTLVLKRLLPEDEQPSRSGLLLLPACIRGLEKKSHEESEATLGPRLIHRLLQIALHSRDKMTLQRSMHCMDVALQERPFLANQHMTESILIAIPRLARNDVDTATAYSAACKVFATLFLVHRARLQGRYHIVVRAFQQLLSQLFTSNKPAVKPINDAHSLTPKHAGELARLLTLFCEPPQHRNDSSDHESLVDQFRKEQARVGQFAQFVLHQYCAQILHGKLREGMREALTPGLWAVIAAMELHESEGVRVLSAAVTESERAVLRGVFEEWRRFGKWRGG